MKKSRDSLAGNSNFFSLFLLLEIVYKCFWKLIILNQNAFVSVIKFIHFIMSPQEDPLNVLGEKYELRVLLVSLSRYSLIFKYGFAEILSRIELR